MRFGFPILALFLVLLGGCRRSDERVVLYCAQDKEFADRLLADFTKQTGIRVEARFDTEATKSVSLYQALVREKAQPRCDVFWNNEILLTLQLEQQGLLAPYSSPQAADYPAWTKARDGSWQAFAARARVFLVSADVPEAERPRTLEEFLDPKWKGKAGIAKPLFGSTAAHLACLAAKIGQANADLLFARLKEIAVVLAGNKDVAEAVSSGRCLVGLTDTDDAIVEVRRGRPVAIVYPDQGGLGTLFLPNTLCLMKGAPHSEAGKKLIDFLLSPESEQRLAEGPSAQIPLNPKVRAKLEIATPTEKQPMEVDFAAAAHGWGNTQSKLRELFAR